MATSTFTLTLVRHGRTEANDRGIIQGHSDTPLNETGRQQAIALAGQLSTDSYDRIFSSDLVRAHQTAQELVRGTKQQVLTDGRLRERSLGSLDGQHGSAFVEQFTAAGLHPDEYTPEGGESLGQLQTRLYDFIENRLLPEAANLPEGAILVCSHGVTIREMIKYLYTYGGDSWPAAVVGAIRPRDDIAPNTSVSQFKVHLVQEGGGERAKVASTEALRLHNVDHLRQHGVQGGNHKHW